MKVTLILFISSLTASAQMTLSNFDVKDTKKSSILENFSASLGANIISDFKESSNESKSTYSTISPSIRYKIDSKQSLSLSVPLQKDLSNTYEENFFLDARLTYSKPAVYKNGIFTLNTSVTYVYPTTENNKRLNDMYAAIELNPAMTFKLDRLSSGLSFTYLPRYRQAFHKYTSNRNGETLTERSMVNFFVLNYMVNDKWNPSITILYVKSWRYDGLETNDSYFSVSELAYLYNSSTSFNVGIQTGGNLISPEQGESKTIEIFNKNTSEVYTGVSYQF